MSSLQVSSSTFQNNQQQGICYQMGSTPFSKIHSRYVSEDLSYQLLLKSSNNSEKADEEDETKNGFNHWAAEPLSHSQEGSSTQTQKSVKSGQNVCGSQSIESKTKELDEQDEYAVSTTMGCLEKQTSRKRKLIEIVFIPRINFSSKQIFYVFADQLINIEYLSRVSNKTENEYLLETSHISQFDGMKFISHVEHRMDTKSIEFSFEMIQPSMNDIEPILRMMRSLGDSTLFQFSRSIENFWNDITAYRQVILNQRNSPLFQEHFQRRTERAIEEMAKITKKIDPNKFIQYTKYQTDYEQCVFDSRFSGYTTNLYELIAGNAYAFKEMLLQKGYHDAVYSKNRLDWCLETASKYFNGQTSNQRAPRSIEFGKQETSIMTLDNFTFPIILTTTVYNLDFAYDQENDLTFQINDILAIYEFELIDPSILGQLLSIRRGTKLGTIVNVTGIATENQLKENISSQYHTLFFEKYYQDDLSTLLKRGNKWNKICGVVEIPQKKFKPTDKMRKEE